MSAHGTTIHCVRHGQGTHNISNVYLTIHDPSLTPLGEVQCRALNKNFSFNNVKLIVASPLRRTLYTAIIGFEDVLKANEHLKVIALPELQELSDSPCDTGSSLEELTMEFEGKPVDFSLVTAGWNVKKGKWAPDPEAIKLRALAARNWLMARPEKEIVVVTHGGFLRHLLEDFDDAGRFTGRSWENAEVRGYTFSDKEPELAHLIETQASRGQIEKKPLGKGDKTPLTRAANKDKDNGSGDHPQATQIQAKA